MEYILQLITDPMLFHPPPRQPPSNFRQDSKNMMVRSVHGADVHVALFCPWDKDTSIVNYTGTAHVLLFFHGNNEDVHSCATYCQWLADHTQLNVVTCDYAGYGFSSGEVSECGLMNAALTAFEFVTYKLQHDVSTIFVVGKSIGSVPAIGVAAKSFCADLAGLLLISPIASGIRCCTASSIMPNMILSKLDGLVLPNLKNIPDVQCPIQFIHGIQDKTVPISNSHMLLEATKRKPYTLPLWVNAGHNDIESRNQCLFLNALRDFIEVCSQRSSTTSRFDF